jgi:hypothetical protein
MKAELQITAGFISFYPIDYWKEKARLPIKKGFAILKKTQQFFHAKFNS